MLSVSIIGWDHDNIKYTYTGSFLGFALQGHQIIVQSTRESLLMAEFSYDFMLVCGCPILYGRCEIHVTLIIKEVEEILYVHLPVL